MNPVRSLPPMLVLVLTLAIAAGWARPSSAAIDESDCRGFISPAESYYQLPPGLLGAMAEVESGQGGIPYPWALNIAGAAIFAPDFRSAARLLRFSNGAIRRDVAIGCLQIHMTYHLAPFGAPEWALLPRYNVWYAALFLRQLAGKYGSWTRAVAHYHASDPTAVFDYLCRVAARLERRAPATRRSIDLPLCRSGDSGSGLARSRR